MSQLEGASVLITGGTGSLGKSPHRRNPERLFERDLNDELVDLYQTLELRESGFVYHRGLFPREYSTWFLLGKV